jgi:hypothetical protein
MQSQNLSASPQAKAMNCISRFFRDSEATAEGIRKTLLESSALSPGEQACLAFDTILAVINLGSPDLLDTALTAIVKCPNKRANRSKESESAGIASTFPKNWGESIARIQVSSNPAGANKLLDGNPRTYWQSSGSCPHWIKLFVKDDGLDVSALGIILSSEDQSYCPLKVTIYVGKTESDLEILSSMNVAPVASQPFAVDISLNSHDQMHVIKISIDSNQQGGCDTRVRGVFLKGNAKTPSVWNNDRNDQILRSNHYVEAGKGSYVPELRMRFNECVRAIIDKIIRDISNPQMPSLASALDFLSIKMDSIDIDFLASCPFDNLFQVLWKHIESEFARYASETIPSDSKFLGHYAAYGGFLVSLLDNLSCAGEQASPVFIKITMEALFVTIRATRLLVTTCSQECRPHFEQFLKLVLPSLQLSKNASKIRSSLQSTQWQELLWDLAASSAIQDVRLCALSLIRDLVLSRPADGSNEKDLARKTLALTLNSSPEKYVFGCVDGAFDEISSLKVRREALLLFACLLQSVHHRQDALEVLIDGIKNPPTCEQFLASVMAMGGTLDTSRYEQELVNDAEQSADVTRIFSDDAVVQMITSITSLLGSWSASDATDADLALSVARTRAAKALWELSPVQRDQAIPSELFSHLVRIAVEPCLVPFDCVFSQRSGSGSKQSWTWGPCEPQNIVLSDDKLTARNKSGSGPDYSCALGSETFEDGTHVWEIEVKEVRSMWLGIARGVKEASGLGCSPCQRGDCLCFASGGGSQHSGFSPIVETVQSSSGFSSGSKVRFELNIPDKQLQMFVDGSLKYICKNVDCRKGVVPYFCSDYTESAKIVFRSSHDALEGKELTLEMMVAKAHAMLPLLSSSSFARIGTYLEEFKSEHGADVIVSAQNKLESAGVTLDDLLSPSLTKERLKSIGISLGLRSSILKKRDACAAMLKMRSDLLKTRNLARDSLMQREPSASKGSDQQGVEAMDESMQLDLESLANKVKDSDFVQKSVPRTPARDQQTSTLAKPPKWDTQGSSYHLLLDVERTLLTIYARLIVYNMLMTSKVARMDALSVEKLLIRSFRSCQDPRPRKLSHKLNEDVMESMLSLAIQGWAKAAEKSEVEKLRGVCLAALSRFSTLLCKSQEKAASAPASKPVPNKGHNPRSEFESQDAGIGCALLIMASLADAGLPVVDLIDSLAPCVLLAPRESCHAILSAAGKVLQRLEKLDFRMGPRLKGAVQMIRNAVVTMIEGEQPRLKPECLHSCYLQTLLDSVSQLETLSVDSISVEGKLDWEFSGQASSPLVPPLSCS